MAEPQTDPQVATCYWHPTVSTRLSCSQCRRAICTDCMVQVPVGIRCHECGRAQPLPTFDVRPANYARALATAAGIVILGAILWFALAAFVTAWLASIVMPLAIGYAAGEIISRVVNLKRSRGLMYIAGGTVVITAIIALVLGSLVLSLWGILATVGGIFIAIARVRL